MTRVSAMRNWPVICRKKRIGAFLGLCFHADRKQVSDLIVACGLRGKRMVPCSAVQSIADGFIMIEDTKRYKNTHHSLDTVFAYNTEGVLFGYVTDYALDLQKMRIQAIEILTGYLPGKNTKRIWVLDYEYRNPNEVMVPASFCCERMSVSKEDGRCVYRR